MKITRMNIKGKKLSSTMADVVFELKKRFSKAGFITGVSVVNSQSIKIGLHMRSFSLDVTKHDRNLQVNPYGKRLTNLPTWDQRVEFNNIVNSVLNKFKVSANVKSGPYTIREGLDSFNEDDWHNQKPDWLRLNEFSGWYIEPVNEKAYLKEKQRLANEKRKLARQAMRGI